MLRIPTRGACVLPRKRQSPGGYANARPGANLSTILGTDALPPSDFHEGASDPPGYGEEADVSVNATLTCLPEPTDTGVGLDGFVANVTPWGPAMPAEKSPGMRNLN